MAQLALAAGDGSRRAPHVTHDDENQRREGNKRRCNERNYAGDDRSAWPLRAPRQAGERLTLGVGEFDCLIVPPRRVDIGQVQTVDLQSFGNLRQKSIIDVLDRCHDRQALVCARRIRLVTNSNCSNDCRLANKTLNQCDRFAWPGQILRGYHERRARLAEKPAA
jgi:hypothetical protein